MARTLALLFDLDDTLVEDAAPTEEAFLATCALAQGRRGLEPRVLARAVRHRARELWQAAPTIAYCRAIGISSAEGLRARFLGEDSSLAALRAWAPEYRQAAWSGALAELGVRDDILAAELARRFVAERGARNRVFPEVPPLLAALRPDYKLAIVTNGAPDLQREKIAGAGLAARVDAIVVSGEIGAGKPDPRPFAVALAALGIGADAALVVGDSLERDIAGARAAGVRGIWLDRDGRSRGQDDAVPVPCIGDLRELLVLLRGAG